MVGICVLKVGSSLTHSPPYHYRKADVRGGEGGASSLACIMEGCHDVL